MTTQALQFVDENLAPTALLACPEPVTPGVDYVLRADPDTGLLMPHSAAVMSGGVPSQGFLIGGQQWNELNHTLGTYQIEAMIVHAQPMEYASPDGSVSGRYTAITITVAGAAPGEDVTVNWATRPDGQPLTLVFTADAEGKVVNMDVVGSTSSPVGDYSGTLSSASGLVGTFSYTLG